MAPATLHAAALELAVEASISQDALARHRSFPPSKLLSGDLASIPLFEPQSASLSLGEELSLKSLEQNPIENLHVTDLTLRCESEVQASKSAGAEARSNEYREDGQLLIMPENSPQCTESIQDVRRRFEQMAAAESSADASLPAHPCTKGRSKAEKSPKHSKTDGSGQYLESIQSWEP